MGLSVRGEFKLVDIIHILQFIIIHGILGVCGYRLFQKSKIRSTRADMMAMSMVSLDSDDLNALKLTSHQC